MDEMPNVNPAPESQVIETVPVMPAAPTRSYTPVECAFAWMSFIASYLFCRAFPIGESPLGGFLLVLALFAAATVMLKLKGAKFGVMPVAAVASALVVSAALVLTSNGFLHFFAYSYALVAYCYFLYSATGNAIKKGLTDLIAIDFVKALFVLPFCSFGQLFKAMFSGKAKGSGKVIGRILIGAVVAIVPTAAVLLLLSYDRGFSDLLSKMFDFDFADIMSHIISIGFAVPIGMYAFGLFVSSVDNKCKDTLTADSCTHAAGSVRVAPAVTVTAAVLPLLFLYVVFFVSQWQYYILGFTGVLPENFSYAQYAREGFFQLCAVSVINLVVIAAVMMLMRRKDDRPPVLLKVLAVTFSVFTLVLISTALAKLFMYIDCYGLTQKRVYAAWMMAVLALIFILIAIKQFLPKLNALAASLALTVVMFAALSLSNADGLIAKYNVDRYLDGSLETVDVYALAELGDAAIPEMVRLANTLEARIDTPEIMMNDCDIYTETKWQLLDIKISRFGEDDKGGLFSYTLPFLRAEKAFENIDLSHI